MNKSQRTILKTWIVITLVLTVVAAGNMPSPAGSSYERARSMHPYAPVWQVVVLWMGACAVCAALSVLFATKNQPQIQRSELHTPTTRIE